MAKYINMGWLAERAIYIDSKDYQFYISDIKKNSNGILLFAPVTGTVLGGIISAISLLLGETSAGFRWIILFICCMTASIASIIGVRLLWRKGNLSPYQPTAYQVRELLEKGKPQRIGQPIIIGIMTSTIIFLSFDYLISGNIRPLIISMFSLSVTLLMVWDHSPLQRRKIIKQLEEEHD